MKEIKRNFTKILQQRLYEELNFIQVVMGPRQVGKTTGLQQIINEWEGPSLLVTADEVVTPSSDWLSLQWQRAMSMGKGVLLVVDEIQKIPDWSRVVKYLFDQGRKKREMKIVLLGSASLSIQRGLAESLAGRYEIIPVHHWNLAECREAFSWDLDKFLKFGGYPAAAELAGEEVRWQGYIRNSIIEPVLIKDILGLSSVGKPALFRQTFELAMAYPAQEISLQKILGQLQESGNVSTIKHYLELLEGAFLIRALQKYTGSDVCRKGSSPKILPLNMALIHAFRAPHLLDDDPIWHGRVFEAAIGAALARSDGRLFYWRQGKYEVDYVVDMGGKLYAVEVKSGKKRSSIGLQKFLSIYPKSIPLIIDKNNGVALLEAEEVGEDMLSQL